MSARITATWAVHAGAWAEGELDIEGLTPDEIAEHVDGIHPGISLCHQCDDDVSDPELVELTSFTVDGREYERGPDGHWRPT